MRKTRATRARKRNLRPRRGQAPTRAVLVKILRPIVRDLMDEEWARREDEGDVKASREAMEEGGAVPHEEFWKKRGL